MMATFVLSLDVSEPTSVNVLLLNDRTIAADHGEAGKIVDAAVDAEPSESSP
jgi:hypothetical protein